MHSPSIPRIRAPECVRYVARPWEQAMAPALGLAEPTRIVRGSRLPYANKASASRTTRGATHLSRPRQQVSLSLLLPCRRGRTSPRASAARNAPPQPLYSPFRTVNRQAVGAGPNRGEERGTWPTTSFRWPPNSRLSRSASRRSLASLLAVALVGSALLVASALMPTTAEAHHLTCLGYPTTIDGTKGPDDIRGTSGRDVVAALGDDDVFADVPSPYDPRPPERWRRHSSASAREVTRPPV